MNNIYMYICKLCNKEFKLKSDLIRHENKKRKCNEKIECFKCNRMFKSLYCLQNHLNKLKPCNDTEIYKCEKCNKQYITKQNFNKHIKNHPEIIETIINNTNSITNSNNINSNNNINITINGFGKENVSYITQEMIQSILNKGFQSIPELIKEKHFNKDHPENHNIYITNLSKKTILIYDGERWILTCKDDILEDIISKNEEFIITEYEELKSKLSIQAVQRLDRFIEALDTPEYLTQLKETIQLILYNYRDIVEKTKLRLKNKTQKTHINSLNISKSS